MRLSDSHASENWIDSTYQLASTMKNFGSTVCLTGCDMGK